MKVLFGLSILMVSTCSGLFAAQCTQTTLDKYMARGFACQVGTWTFSNFTYTASGSQPASASAITVVPGESEFSAGLEFIGSWDVGNGQSSQGDIQFAVSGGGLDSLSIEQGSGTSSGGAAWVIANGCVGAKCSPVGGSITAFTYEVNGSSETQANATFSSTSDLTVLLSAAATAGQGRAALNSARVFFSSH